MSIIPVEVPTGAIRYNTDSQKMECFNGTQWMQVAVSSPDLEGGGRIAYAGGNTGSDSDVIEYVTVSTTGNAADFGDLDGSDGRAQCAGFFTNSWMYCGW